MIRIHAGLPEQFWDYAEKLASVVSSYIVKEGEEISPFQKLYGRKPNIELIALLVAMLLCTFPERTEPN